MPTTTTPEALLTAEQFANRPDTGLAEDLDDQHRSAHVFGHDGTHHELGPDDELALPELLGNFRVAVRRFFE